MALLFVLLILLFVFGVYGGFALTPFLWILVALVLIAALFGLGGGHFGGPRRW